MAKKRVLLVPSPAGPPLVQDGIYVGCDQSISGTGLVAVDTDGQYISHRLVKGGEASAPMQALERIINIFQDMYQWINSLKDDKVPCVVLEDFAFSQANQMALLGGLGYHIRVMLRQTGWNFSACPTGTLKKIVVGKGNANKSAMILGVYKRWAFETEDDNIADAFGLAKIAWMAYAKPIPGSLGTRQSDFAPLDKLKVYR